MKCLLSLSTILAILLSTIVALTPHAASAAPRASTSLATQPAALASPDDVCPTDKQIIYVQEDASGDGSSWSSPYGDLQEALAAASDTDTYSYEIWVAAGRYKPGSNPDDTFNLKNCVALYGGFDGSETDRAQRNPDPDTNGTVLFGTQWVHVAVTLESGVAGNTASLYIDGKVEVTGTVSYTPTQVVGANMWLGKSQFHGTPYNDPYLDGKLDEVAVYDRALDAGEVAAIYASGWSDADDEQIVALHLDESTAMTGTVLIDSSGLDNRVTLLADDDADKASVGYLNGALALDGTDDYVDLPEILASAGEFSFLAWVAWHGGDPWQRIFDFGQDTNNYMFLTPRSDAGTFRFAIKCDGGAEEILEAPRLDASNSHVVSDMIVDFVDASAVLDSFTVTGGDAGEEEAGGGMGIDSGSPTLTNVTFIDNSAGSGGGMSIWYGSPTLTNVSFTGNSANDRGGGMSITHASPTLTNVTFTGNSARMGGGMGNYESWPTLTNVTFTGNSASHEGGGMWNFVYEPQVQNSILWGNTPDQIVDVLTTSQVTYSDVQGGWAGEGNINTDPLFVDTVGGDLRLQAGSPVIDAGSNALLRNDVTDLDEDGDITEQLSLDLDGDSRVVALVSPTPVVDMGAYEYQNQAPTAQAGGPYAGVEGGTVAMSGTGTDPEGRGMSYVWDCTGDGTTDGTTDTFACPYSNDGSFAAHLTVTDSGGMTDTASVGVDISNVAPLLTGLSGYSATEGVSVGFTLGSFTDPGADSPWDIEVDWGDGTAKTTFENPIRQLQPAWHTYAQDGTYPSHITVEDGDGGQDSAAFQVTVSNVAPAVTPPEDQGASAGASTAFDLGSINDPGADTPWGVAVDWGDGTGVTTFDSPTKEIPHQFHTYAQAGIYNVNITVADDEESGSANFPVSVTDQPLQNLAPSFTSTPQLHATVGLPYTYNVTATDPDNGDTLTINAPTLPDWLTLTFTGNETATLHGTPDSKADADNNVVLRAIDAAGATSEQYFSITIWAASPDFGGVEGAVYEDGNGNGGLDDGEGIAGVTVTLSGEATAAALDGEWQQQTGTDGGFHFADIPAGDYTLSVTPSTGYALVDAQPMAVTVEVGRTTQAPTCALAASDEKLFLPSTGGGS